ncbi:MAG: HlyD family efflux transporter periplasmic adaptor subunit, partial [Gemmatimonadales bacterium]
MTMSDRTPVPDPDLRPASDDPAPVAAPAPQPATVPATAPATLPATLPPAQPPTTTTARRTSERPRRIVTRGRIIAAVVLLALIAITVRLVRGTPLSVEVAQVTRGPLQVTVDADAVTRVRSRFTITAPVAGLVSRITYSEGDTVNAKDVVAVIAPPPTDPTARGVAQAALRAAEAARSNASANLARATTSLAQAERDAGRTRTLAAGGALANRDVELA